MRALVVLALVLAACGAAVPANTGIRGTVLAGPACPGPARIDSPCPDRPVAMTIEVVNGSDVAATVTSDAAGAFSVSLAPGSYTIRSKSGLPILKSQAVVVVAGQYANVELHADTGIR
jgi:hypothetical protein